MKPLALILAAYGLLALGYNLSMPFGVPPDGRPAIHSTAGGGVVAVTLSIFWPLLPPDQRGNDHNGFGRGKLKKFEVNHFRKHPPFLSPRRAANQNSAR